MHSTHFYIWIIGVRHEFFFTCCKSSDVFENTFIILHLQFYFLVNLLFFQTSTYVNSLFIYTSFFLIEKILITKDSVTEYACYFKIIHFYSTVICWGGSGCGVCVHGFVVGFFGWGFFVYGLQLYKEKPF